MTESAAPSRIRAYVWAGAAVFVAAVVAVAGTLTWNARQAALADSEAQATRFVAGAEAAASAVGVGYDLFNCVWHFGCFAGIERGSLRRSGAFAGRVGCLHR